MQKAIEDGFDQLGFNGAAVVLDPSNGDVLGFTSRPAYDPNAFARASIAATWASLTTDEDRPLNDRAIQGRYSPGSTFKMAVATAALEEGVITPDFKVHCAGGATFYGRPFKCWKKGGHGTMDLRHAIEQSCNVYFYTIGNMTGIDKIHKWATLLGLGEKSGIDLPNEVQGLVPSPEWKQRAIARRSGTPARRSRSSIGQGAVSVTPVSMAVYVATLANGGTRVTPHLLKAVDEGSGWKPVPPPAPQSRSPLDPDKLQAIRDGLCHGRERRAAPATTRSIEGLRRVGQDRHGAGDFEPGQGARRARPTRICATTAGSCSSRRATSPRSPASCSSSTACTARTPRWSRITCSTRSSRRRKGGRCRRSREFKPNSWIRERPER